MSWARILTLFLVSCTLCILSCRNEDKSKIALKNKWFEKQFTLIEVTNIGTHGKEDRINHSLFYHQEDKEEYVDHGFVVRNHTNELSGVI